MASELRAVLAFVGLENRNRRGLRRHLLDKVHKDQRWNARTLKAWTSTAY